MTRLSLIWAVDALLVVVITSSLFRNVVDVPKEASSYVVRLSENPSRLSAVDSDLHALAGPIDCNGVFGLRSHIILGGAAVLGDHYGNFTKGSGKDEAEGGGNREEDKEKEEEDEGEKKDEEGGEEEEGESGGEEEEDEEEEDEGEEEDKKEEDKEKEGEDEGEEEDKEEEDQEEEEEEEKKEGEKEDEEIEEEDEEEDPFKNIDALVYPNMLDEAEDEAELEIARLHFAQLSREEKLRWYWRELGIPSESENEEEVDEEDADEELGRCEQFKSKRKMGKEEDKEKKEEDEEGGEEEENGEEEEEEGESWGEEEEDQEDEDEGEEEDKKAKEEDADEELEFKPKRAKK